MKKEETMGHRWPAEESRRWTTRFVDKTEISVKRAALSGGADRRRKQESDWGKSNLSQ